MMSPEVQSMLERTDATPLQSQSQRAEDVGVFRVKLTVQPPPTASHTRQLTRINAHDDVGQSCLK